MMGDWRKDWVIGVRWATRSALKAEAMVDSVVQAVADDDGEGGDVVLRLSSMLSACLRSKLARDSGPILPRLLTTTLSETEQGQQPYSLTTRQRNVLARKRQREATRRSSIYYWHIILGVVRFES